MRREADMAARQRGDTSRPMLVFREDGTGGSQPQAENGNKSGTKATKKQSATLTNNVQHAESDAAISGSDDEVGILHLGGHR